MQSAASLLRLTKKDGGGSLTEPLPETRLAIRAEPFFEGIVLTAVQPGNRSAASASETAGVATWWAAVSCSESINRVSGLEMALEQGSPSEDGQL